VAKIRMALIGQVRGRGTRGVYASHHLSELVAVCDSSGGKPGRWRTNSAFLISSITRNAGRYSCDAVGIVTPDFAHAAPIIAAARRNRHILCEKPLATSAADLAEIMKALKGKNIQLMVDYHNRWNPPICKIKDDVDAGKIGKVVSA